MSHRLADAASRVVSLFEQAGDQRLALAESCTGGTAAATLIGIPGVSRFFCGSAVTYRESAKMAWLGVEADVLAQHSPVSAIVTEQMAFGLLRTLGEANVGAAITGHFGPFAPAQLDGVVFTAIATRKPDGVAVVTSSQCRQLIRPDRAGRIAEASALLLEHLAGWMVTRRQPARLGTTLPNCPVDPRSTDDP